MKRTRQKLMLGMLALVLVVGLGVGVFGCAKEPAAPVVEEWNIPILTELTGAYAGYGVEYSWAMDWAVKDLNAAGGIAGKPLRVTYYDSGSDPSKGTAEINKMLDTNPLAVVLATTALVGKAAVVPPYEEQVLTLGAGCSTTVTEPFRPWAVSFVNYDELCCGAETIGWIEREPDIKTVVSLSDNTDQWFLNCVGARHAWLEEAGIELVQPVTFDQFTVVDWGPVAATALDRGADGYLLTCHGAVAASIIIELERRGMVEKQRICMHGCCNYPDLYEVGAGHLDGCYISCWWDPNNPGERWQAMVERYKEVSEFAPGFGTWQAIDIPYFLKAAIEATGVTGDPTKLAEEQLRLAKWAYNVKDFPFVMGTYDVVDGVVMHGMVLETIEGDKQVLLAEMPAAEVPAKYLPAPQFPQ